MALSSHSTYSKQYQSTQGCDVGITLRLPNIGLPCSGSRRPMLELQRGPAQLAEEDQKAQDKGCRYLLAPAQDEDCVEYTVRLTQIRKAKP